MTDIPPSIAGSDAHSSNVDVLAPPLTLVDFSGETSTVVCDNDRPQPGEASPDPYHPLSPDDLITLEELAHRQADPSSAIPTSPLRSSLLLPDEQDKITTFDPEAFADPTPLDI